MDSDELPAHLREKVDLQLRKGDRQREIVETLLRKRAAATAEQRKNIDALIMDLGKPSRVGRWLALVAAVVGGVVAYQLWSEYAYEQAVIAGTPTVAQVKRLDEGGCMVGRRGYSCVSLTLEVHPESGAPYPASLTRAIELRWMSRVQPGSWLTVAVDRAEPSRVYFDVRSMATRPPTP